MQFTLFLVRVIYVPDCAAWGYRATLDFAIEFLLTAIALAFPGENEIIDKCDTIAGLFEVEKFLQVCCMLYVVCCMLYVVCCVLCVVCFVFCVVCCVLCVFCVVCVLCVLCVLCVCCVCVCVCCVCVCVC